MAVPSDNDATRTLKDLLNISSGALTGASHDGSEGGAQFDSSQGGIDVRDGDSSGTMSLSSSVQSQVSKSKQGLEMSDAESSVMTSYSDGLTPRTLAPVKQNISLTGNDMDGSVSIYGNEVEIIQSLAESSSGSSKVIFDSMVNYEWERRYYMGNLLAVNNTYIAYTLKARDAANREGTPTARYVVRVLNPRTVRRALIKGFTGRITDISFAHRQSNTLACVDEAGNLYVWEILEEDDKVVYNPKLHIVRNDGITSEFHRLVWCPHIITEEELQSERSSTSLGGRMDEGGRVLAITHNNEAEVYDLDVVCSMYTGSPLTANDVTNKGLVAVRNGHIQPITDGALSPDGTVLATSSKDGYVKFWQIAFDSDDEPSCLHNWQPHDGRPVSCLLFCDNHTSQDASIPFWRFLITGTQYNSELKIWCTVTWTCLQTIRFSAPESAIPNTSELVARPCLKAHLDLTASYLVLSDVSKKVLYVFLLHQNMDSGKAHLTSLSEFLLAQPILSFVIREARLYRLRSTSNSGEMNGNHELDEVKDADEDDEDDFLEEGKPKKPLGLLLRILSIQTHSLQELTVRFQPEPSVAPPTPSDLSVQSQDYKGLPQDQLSDMSGMETGGSTNSDEVDTVVEHSPKPKLITPEAFVLSHARLVAAEKEAKQDNTSLSSSSNSSITMVSALKTPHDQSASDVMSSVSSDVPDTVRTITPLATPDATPPVTPQAKPMTIVDQLATALSLPLPPSPDPSTIPFPNFQSTPQKFDISHAMASSDEPSEGAAQEVDRGDEEQGEDEVVEKEDLDVEIEDSDEMTQAQHDANDALIKLLGRLPRPSTPPSPEERKRIHAAVSIAEESVLNEVVGEAEEEVAEEVAKNTTFRPETPPSDDNMGLSEDLLTPAEAMYRESRELIREQLLIGLEVSPQKHTDIPPETVELEEEKPPYVSMDQVMMKLSTQENMIWDLRQLMVEQQRQEAGNFSKSLREEVNRLEFALGGRIDKALAEHGKEEGKRLDKAIREHGNSDKQKQEKLAASVSQTITQVINSRLEKIVKAEIKNSVLPGIQKSLNPVTEQLNTTLAQKLTATDAVLKESISKMVKSKAVIDTIATSVAGCLQGPIQSLYKETFQKMVIPSFEKACQGMFHQINESFQTGTQQYLNQLEAFIETVRRQQEEARDPIVKQLHSQIESFQRASERLSSSLMADVQTMLDSHLTTALQSLRDDLMARLEDEMVRKLQLSIHEEVKSAIHENSQQFGDLSITSSVDGRAQALQQHQERLKSVIDSGNYANAFQEALSASDLSLVTYVCQNIDISSIFSTNPCLLIQPVLLSLIQQLSVDLMNQTELKHSYLEEAIYALDVSDEITRQHMPGILDGLCQHLTEVLQLMGSTDPTNSMYRPLQKLQILAKGTLAK